MIRHGPDNDNVSEENTQNHHILSILIRISWGTYLVVLLSCLFFRDSIGITATLISIVLLILPFWLLKHEHLFFSGLLLVVIVLANVTFMATMGQGIHDIAIMAYPIIIIFACMVLNRVYFRISTVLIFASMSWLVFGEAYGIFKSHPYLTPNWADFLVIAAILLTAVFATDMLVTNMRRNLALARKEINHRKLIEEQLRYQSTHDVMTGIYNRNFFEAELARLERSREYPITIVIADIDGLKTINDTLGHAVGDKQLQLAANLLHSVFRAEDILARIGGDEFAALLPATDLETAEKIVSRINERLTEYNTQNSGMPVHLSIGAAIAEKSKLTETFTLADHRMYAEKSVRTGRVNRICIS